MRRSSRCWFAIAAFSAAMLAGAGSTAAADDGDLYRSTVFVTGQGEAERARGTGIAFEEVLVKVSGDPRLLRDPRVADIKKEAGKLVASFDYRDRKKGLPLIDEQGTRDRPFDLTVHFDRAKTDAALGSLDRTPWSGPRPRLAVFLGVQDQQTRYVLAQDGARGLGQRQSLAAVAAKRALPVVLPDQAALGAQHVTYDELAAKKPPVLERAAKAVGANAGLSGTLVWTEAALGWTASWHMGWQGKEHDWGIRGVSFDDAFRNAIDGAAEILSGHGGPDQAH